MAALEAVRNDVTSSIQRMSPPQRITLGLAFAATAIGMFLVARVTGNTAMSTLYADLEPAAAAAIVDELESQGIEYELSAGGRVIQVPSDQVHAVRLDMSSLGLPGSGDGWSILDNQGITTSEFDQRVGYQRAMEGELAKTISAIDGIAEANVHLVIPDNDLFVGDDIQASASVLLVNAGSQSISPMQVEAIVNLVASSVEGMTPERVSITDESGRILAAPGEGSSVVGLEGDSQLRAKAQYEAGLEADLESLLAAVVGPGLAVVNVTADLDFDSVVTVTEQYQPTESIDGQQVVLAETTRNELYEDADGDLEVGVLGTEILPDTAADGTATDGSGVNYSLDERDATYAMNKVVTNAENAAGALSSLSVAVLLDETAIDAARLAEIETLVQAAAGIDLERGDNLAVSLMPINETVRASIEAANTPAEPAVAAGMDLVGLIRTVGTVVIALVVILLGLKSIRKKDDEEEVSVEELDSEQLALEAGTDDEDDEDDEDDDTEPPEIQLQNLIANQPDDVAGVLRSWLNESQEVPG